MGTPMTGNYKDVIYDFLRNQNEQTPEQSFYKQNEKYAFRQAQTNAFFYAMSLPFLMDMCHPSTVSKMTRE